MESIILIVLLIAIFYFLLIRPQQKQRRQLQEVQSSLTPGATVMTGSGLIGTVTSVGDDRVELEVAPGIVNTYVRRAIVQVFHDESASPEVDLGEDAAQQNPGEDRETATDEPSSRDRRDDPGGATR